MLEDGLAEGDGGRWAALEVGLIVPRQNGKGAVLEALELAWLFLFGDQLVLHSAHEFKTAAEGFRRLKFLIQSTPDLDRRVRRIWESHGSEGIELLNGNRIRFVARSKGSGRGFSGDKIVLDEAYELSDAAMEALYPTLSARPNPQVWFTSSAPLDTDGSNVLRRLCKRGRAGSPRLAYMEFCARPDAQPDDLDAMREANPALGIRLSPDFVDVERAAMTREGFLRERLGLWNEDPEESERVIPTRLWVACAGSTSIPDGERVAFALDVPPDRRWSSFAVAGPTGDGRVHLEVVSRLPGTDQAAAEAARLCKRWGATVSIGRGSPAASLEPELVKLGVPVRWVSTEEHAQACGDFYDAVIAGTVAHLDDPDLNKAVEGAATRTYGDSWLWSRRKAGVDIAPLVAVTLARWCVVNPTTEPVKPVFAW